MRVTFDQTILGAFIVAVFLMGGLGLLSLQDIDRQVASAGWVEHSENVIERLQDLLIQVEQASTGLRGYVLTSRPDYLRSLDQVQQDLPRQVEALKAITSDNPQRQLDIPAIQVLLNQYVASARRLADASNSLSSDSLADELNESNAQLAKVEAKIRSIQDDERVVLQRRVATARKTFAVTRSAIEAGSACGIILLIGATWLLFRETKVRRQAEATLRQSEEQLHLMIENVKDYAIVLLDATGRVLNWNSGAERIQGYRPEEIIGRHASVFHAEEKIHEGFPHRELRDTARQGRVEDEGWRVRKNGSRFLANVVTNAVRDETGKLLGFVQVTRDITEQKETEARIQNLHEELEKHALELETSNQELEAFSYTVSHDLRAPLRHINGFVEILQQSPAVQQEPANQRYMNIIAKASRDMGTLIDELLAFSRTGRAEMHPVRLDMRKMVDQVIMELESECSNRQIDWEIRSFSPVLGDSTLLRLVWTNLISNAIKYTRPRQKARIEIGQTESNPGDEEVFYIRDNGVGFNMAYADKLFGVFQRLHRAEDFEGTGIGLANVQRIVIRHGGRVWAESEPNSGSVFYFSLPSHLTQPELLHA